jgi:hypothetical protein
MDDENIIEIDNINIIEQLERTHFKCQTFGQYILLFFVANGVCNCESGQSPYGAKMKI